MVQLAERTYTAQEFLRLREGESYELDDGALRELPVGAESEHVAFELLRRLGNFLEGKRLGRVVAQNVGLQVFAGRPNRVPRPDGGFIRTSRLPGGRMPKGWLRVAPDLVVESISPNDEAVYIERKVQEYLGAGVLLVWVLYPDTRTAMVYRANGAITHLDPDGALDGEDVIPGFLCHLAAIMPPAEE